jgi:dipeptidyl aminopeptidase/acylaminoacyl peptidase
MPVTACCHESADGLLTTDSRVVISKRFFRTLPTPMIRCLLLLSGLGLQLSAPLIASPQVIIRDTGPLYYENVPETPAAIREMVHPFLQVRSASFSGWLADGGMLIRTRLGETTQIYRVDQPGGRRQQLTFFTEPVQFARPTQLESGERVVLLRDTGGSEDFQIYTLDLYSRRISLESDGKARHGAVVLSRCGQRAAYYSTQRNGRDWDLYVIDLASGRQRRVLEAGGAWMPLEWAPDDDILLVMQVVSSAESHPYLLDLKTLELAALSERESPIAFRSLRFGRDSGQILLITDLDREYLGLFSMDRATGQKALLLEVDWDVTEIEVAPDGSELAAVVNEQGYGRLRRLSLPEGQPLPMPPLPDGVISAPAYSTDGRQLAFNFTAADVSGDVFSIELDGGQVVRWTYSEVGGLSADRFITPELIHYPTFDEHDGQRRQVPAWVYRPVKSGPHPVVIEIHGGPAAQRRPGFSSNFQLWATELGLAVVAPNVRGSSGYGKTWLSLDDGRSREDAVHDIGALLDWIADQPDLDEGRVVVYGGSYGGYLVLASLIHHGDRLAGGISIVGIGNFVTFLENTRPYRRDLRRAEYGDERDRQMRAFLESISPANQAERLSRPLLVIHGLNDPRVPASEAEQIIAAMRRAGHNPWYLLARNEGHGFQRQSNRLARAEAETLFLQKVLTPARQ